MATAWMQAAMPTQPLISSARRASEKPGHPGRQARPRHTPEARRRRLRPTAAMPQGNVRGPFPLPSSKLRPPAESIIPVHATQTGKTASAQAHPQQIRSMPPARQAGKLRSSPIFRSSYRILSKTRHRQDGGKNGAPKPGGTGLHQHPRHGKPLKPPSPPITGAAASTRAIQTDRIPAALPCAISRRSAAAPRAANISPQDRLPPRAETSSRPFMDNACVCPNAQRAAATHPAEELNNSRTGHGNGRNHATHAAPAARKAKPGKPTSQKASGARRSHFPRQ